MGLDGLHPHTGTSERKTIDQIPPKATERGSRKQQDYKQNFKANYSIVANRERHPWNKSFSLRAAEQEEMCLKSSQDQEMRLKQESKVMFGLMTKTLMNSLKGPEKQSD